MKVATSVLFTRYTNWSHDTMQHDSSINTVVITQKHPIKIEISDCVDLGCSPLATAIFIVTQLASIHNCSPSTTLFANIPLATSMWLEIILMAMSRLCPVSEFTMTSLDEKECNEAHEHRHQVNAWSNVTRCLRSCLGWLYPLSMHGFDVPSILSHDRFKCPSSFHCITTYPS